MNAPPTGRRALDGLTLPGFANAHSHAFHRALRGRTHGGGGTFWTWRDQMYGSPASLDPDTYQELATRDVRRDGARRHHLVGEFHYLHHGPDGVPYADANEMGHRLLRAAERAGIRITLLDTCYLHGGIGEPLNDVQRRFSDGTRTRGRSGCRPSECRASPIRTARTRVRSRTRVGNLGPQRRGGDPLGAGRRPGVDRRWSRRGRTSAGAVLHAHVSEQPAENHDCMQALRPHADRVARRRRRGRPLSSPPCTPPT